MALRLLNRYRARVGATAFVTVVWSVRASGSSCRTYLVSASPNSWLATRVARRASSVGDAEAGLGEGSLDLVDEERAHQSGRLGVRDRSLQHGSERRTGRGVLPDAEEGADQAFRDVVGVAAEDGRERGSRIDRRLDGSVEEVLFAAEVVVDERRIDAGLACDTADRGAVVS